MEIAIFEEFENHLKAEIQNLGGRYVWTDVLLQGDHKVQKNIKNGQFRLRNGNKDTVLTGDYESCKAALDNLNLSFKHDHLVLLIHGLGRHAGIMTKMENALRDAGYEAHSLNYATLFESVKDHANHFENLLKHIQGIKRVSFVTHSLGGLVAREILGRETEWNGSKAYKLIMMGTPNKGAEIAEFLSRLKVFEVLSGPSGQDVRPKDQLTALPEPTIPTLVIAGGRGNTTGFNPLLSGDNDGIVTVDETRLTVPHEFKLIPVIHTIIMDNKTAIEETLKFLKS